MLENKRVLREFDVALECMDSVTEIRDFISHQVGETRSNSKLNHHLREMRAACREFLDAQRGRDFSSMKPRYLRSGSVTWLGPWDASFQSDLSRLRSSIGVQLAAISADYGLRIEKELSRALSLSDSEGRENQ